MKIGSLPKEAIDHRAGYNAKVPVRTFDAVPRSRGDTVAGEDFNALISLTAMKCYRAPRRLPNCAGATGARNRQHVDDCRQLIVYLLADWIVLQKRPPLGREFCGETLQSRGSTQLVAQQGGLAAIFRPIADKEAVALAEAYYDVSGRAIRLTTEKDDTFLLEDSLGPKFILKIANPAEDITEIDCQVKLLRHIEHRDPKLPVPRVIPTRSNVLHFRYKDRAGQSRQVRLMSYLAGVPLSEISSTKRIREKVGVVLGRLRLSMADYHHSADARVLAWDVKHLSSLQSLLSEIADPSQRATLEAAFARFAEIEHLIAATRWQVVHNDFSKSNIVVDPNSSSVVSGIIDFGDAVRTSIAIDLSTALLNQLPADDRADMFADARDVLRGYLTVADLEDAELRLVPHLVMARIVARTVLTIWRARVFPENADYILRNTAQGWAQLNWFLQRSLTEVSDELLQAMR
ncbi:phosphotransferase [Tardiphaga robiniae]|uniref:Hydroxylysine kinase n=1 Tax=Tardiphaga robiniae TaxID=943830 RepID=A0A7G6U1I8_9BRAD|nr:phosphotransferase [Tardiphaga robiniae]QND72870.1 phosphotransferase [Tardiphaga robiniae]